MSETPWFRQKRHYRALRDRLLAEGFEILEAWTGRHLRVRVQRGGLVCTTTLSCTPEQPEHAVNVAMQRARRGTRPEAHA